MRLRREWRSLALGCLLFGCCGACAHRPGAAWEKPALVRPDVMPGNFSWRQRVELRFAGRTRVFDAVLEKSGTRLSLVGLAPFGGVLLAVSLDGSRVSVSGPLAATLPFPPEYLLRDVERCYFPVFDAGSPADGVRTRVVDGVQIAESWSEGRLQTRSFRSLPARASTRIVYGPPRPDGGYQSVDLTEERRGYRLSITTH